MSANEPKDAAKSPFQAGLGLNVLAICKVFITHIKPTVNPNFQKNKFIFLRENIN